MDWSVTFNQLLNRNELLRAQGICIFMKTLKRC